MKKWEKTDFIHFTSVCFSKTSLMERRKTFWYAVYLISIASIQEEQNEISVYEEAFIFLV